jgi:alpha,alpha-trehalose phosphorylase (configuration-retaining)
VGPCRLAANLTKTLYLGLAARQDEHGQVEVGYAAHDGTYSIDFAVHVFEALDPDSSVAQDMSDELANHIVSSILGYQQDHLYKFVGAGVTKALVNMSPQLPSRLWSELDIVPMVFEQEPEILGAPIDVQSVDEEADEMARKCLMQFGPTQQPKVQMGHKNQVQVDCSGHAQITRLEQYPATVGRRTWEATMRYANSLKRDKVKIAFFNSTPQGGGVALMRHALIRFLRLVGIDARWYVPRSKPEIFRITKTNHNILQGVADPKERLTKQQQDSLDEWCLQNAERFWTSVGGPLAPRSQGGADFVVIDDPQMPGLVRHSKRIDPGRPVVFRSHIQVRSDLADREGTPTSEVWKWIWNNIQYADVFISHPVKEFVPSSVDFNKVGYLPATTDWLDGLNKELNDFITQYYFHEFSSECNKQRMATLDFPNRNYIVQIARFDPAKGIPDVLASYAQLRRKHMGHLGAKDTPQLVIAGHGAVDDPDGSRIYDETLELIETTYSDIRSDIVVMRLGPTDQLLNTLMSNAKVALQLSTREGFEVKVSEAVHKGIPIIAAKSGGIPLQVQHGKSGFLVEPGDSAAVAAYLHELFTDEELYIKMSEYAATHVSDEVGTVGNALSWLYLADTLTKGEKLEPNCRWINDMARETAGLPYEDGETRLPRYEGLNLPN